MAATVDWDGLVEEIRRRHGAHTVLVYGSHARGEANAASDLDLVAVRSSGGPARDVRGWNGLAIDLFVVEDGGVEAMVKERAPELRDARPLAQKDGLGDRIVAEVRARLSTPPPAMPAGELAALWSWGQKMRGRVRHPDPTVSAYHRAVLVTETLHAWAEVRGRWFFGPKATIRALALDDPAMHAAYVAAARPGADVTAFDGLLDAVFDPSLRPAGL